MVGGSFTLHARFLLRRGYGGQVAFGNGGDHSSYVGAKCNLVRLSRKAGIALAVNGSRISTYLFDGTPWTPAAR